MFYRRVIFTHKSDIFAKVSPLNSALKYILQTMQHSHEYVRRV